jgi:hypothetical protein
VQSDGAAEPHVHRQRRGRPARGVERGGRPPARRRRESSGAAACRAPRPRAGRDGPAHKVISDYHPREKIEPMADRYIGSIFSTPAHLGDDRISPYLHDALVGPGVLPRRRATAAALHRGEPRGQPRAAGCGAGTPPRHSTHGIKHTAVNTRHSTHGRIVRAPLHECARDAGRAQRPAKAAKHRWGCGRRSPWRRHDRWRGSPRVGL